MMLGPGEDGIGGERRRRNAKRPRMRAAGSLSKPQHKTPSSVTIDDLSHEGGTGTDGRGLLQQDRIVEKRGTVEVSDEDRVGDGCGDGDWGFLLYAT